MKLRTFVELDRKDMHHILARPRQYDRKWAFVEVITTFNQE
jgi:hypothetical protein